MSAVSVVPPPTSMTRLATGSWIGSPDPIAAAIGWPISTASLAPARRAASRTARRSTGVMADGTHTTTRGRLNRPTRTRCRSSRIIRWVTSKSVIAPCRSGRSATMSPGVRPIICQASCPMASTSRVRVCRAITVGSFRTMPRPRS